METVLPVVCTSCGRHVKEGLCCEREAWLKRRREVLHSILAGMSVKLKAAGTTVLLADAESGHVIFLQEADDDETGVALCGAGAFA